MIFPLTTALLVSWSSVGKVFGESFISKKDVHSSLLKGGVIQGEWYSWMVANCNGMDFGVKDIWKGRIARIDRKK